MNEHEPWRDMVGAGSHPDELQLAAYLDGTLESGERAAVEAHLNACDECRASVAAVSAVLAARTEAGPRVRPKRRWPIAAALAAAASVALLLMMPGAATDPQVERASRGSEDLPEVEVVVPAPDAVVSADEVVLSWRPASAHSYAVVVMDADGAVVWSAQVADTQAVVPAGELSAGTSHYWYVDAIADRVVATSSVRRFRTAP